MPRKQVPSPNNIYKDKPDYLSVREYIFLEEYLKTGNKKQSAIKAGYPERSASQQVSRFLSTGEAKKYIEERSKAEGSRVADTSEVLEFLTATMRGEILDSFGIEASVADRLKAAKELLDRFDGVQNNTGQVTIINNIPRPDTIIEANVVN